MPVFYVNQEFHTRLSSKSRAVCLFRSALIDAFPSFLSSLHHYLTTSSWSYHHTGTLPRLISFVCHSYENCRGVYQQFPFWNSTQPHPKFPCPLPYPLSFTFLLAIFTLCTKSVSQLFSLQIDPHSFSKQPGVGEGRAMLNSHRSVSLNGACLDRVGALIPILCSDFQLLTVNFQHLLGLCRRVRGRFSRALGFRDRGERLNVEFLVIPIPRHDTGLDPFHQQEAHSDVRFHVGRQPHLVIHEPLFVDEAGTLLQIRQQAAGNFHVAGEIRFQPRHVARFFVHPNNTGVFPPACAA